MLSFRNKLNSRDPEAIRKISASTGFFDATDIEISINLAHSALDGQRHANDNVEEPSFLLAEDNGKTEKYRNCEAVCHRKGRKGESTRKGQGCCC